MLNLAPNHALVMLPVALVMLPVALVMLPCPELVSGLFQHRFGIVSASGLFYQHHFSYAGKLT
jgi:hypothetical protein